MLKLISLGLQISYAWVVVCLMASSISYTPLAEFQDPLEGFLETASVHNPHYGTNG